MRLCGKSILCMVALFMMASSLARAADPDWIAPDERDEISSESACDCDAAASCGGSCGGVPLPVFVPNLRPGFQFSGSLLYLRPGADNLGYATITTFLPLENPQWAVQTLNPQFQPGFNVGAQYAFPCSGKDFRVNWDHLRTSDSASAAVSNPATQWISPFNQTGPSTSERANEVGIFHLKAAQAQVNFDYDMVNFEVGQTVNVGLNTQVRLFTGLSCVRLREQLVSTFYNDPNIDPVPPVMAIPNTSLRSISLNNTSTYTGLGPRLGLTTAHNLSHGFTFVGQLSGAILAGWMQPAQYSFTAVFDDAVNSEQISSHRVSQVVYASDAKLGLGYSRLLGNGSIVNLESGFKAAIFINPFSTYETSTNVLPLDIGSLSTNSMRHTPSNFTLNGFYATCSLQW
jgi:hypothetical protein